MEVSRARRRPPRQQQPISIRLWDIGWGLWGALRLVLGSLLAETLRRARLLKSREEPAPRPPPGKDDDTPSLLAAERATTRRPSKGSSKASEVCGRSWITWVSLWASPRRWVRAGTGFAWLLVSRWTSLVGLTLQWTSSVVIAIKDADAKSTRRLEEELQGHVRGSSRGGGGDVCKDGGKSCVHCGAAFNLLFNRKLVCRECTLGVCRDCATYDSRDRGWYCRLCEQQRSLRAQSCEWFYDNVKVKFNHFGSTKVLLSLYGPKKTDKQSDLGATEQEESDVQQHVESVIESLLGESLDSASVSHLYRHPLYEKIFSDHREKLLEGVSQFTRALLIALQGKQCEGDFTPTSTHATLKELISNLSKDVDSLPFLQEERKPSTKSASACSDASGSEDGDDVVCDTYEELLVAATINKAVEMAQRKYASNNGSSDLKNACEPDIIRTAKKDHIDVGCQSDIPLSDSGQEEEEFTEETESDEFFWSRVKEDPFKYIIEEKIEEEITEAYTESDDERSRALSDTEECSNSPGTQVPFTLDLSREHRVPFPEMGVDIVTPYAVDSEEEDADDVDGGNAAGSPQGQPPVWTTCVQDWEDNWLFRQRKRSSALGAFRGGRYAAYYDPINMVIPNPSDDGGRVRLGSRDLDELSEMSEKLSVGSLDLSSASDSEEDASPTRASDVFVEKEPAKTRVANGTAKAAAVPTKSPDAPTTWKYKSLTDDETDDRGVPKPKPRRGVSPQNQDAKVTARPLTSTPKKERKEHVSAAKIILKQLRIPSYTEPAARKPCRDPSLRFSLQPDTKTTLHAGKIAKFVCEVSSPKLLGVAWFRGKEQLVPNDHCRMIRLRGKEYVLELYDVNKNDEGGYSAVAYTDKDEVWCDFALAVRATSRAANAPDFTVTPHLVELTGDSWVQISCTVSGYPEPRVWFLRDDLPLPDSEEDRFCVENKGYGEWCLRMQSPTPDDEARYTAVAGNSTGKAQSSITFRLSDLKVKPASGRPVKEAAPKTNHDPSHLLKKPLRKVEAEAKPQTGPSPLVIQRTWAERQAAMQPTKVASVDSCLLHDDTSTFKNVDEHTELVPSVEVLNAPPKPGTIAEREHAKWLNAVPLPNNPYSVENLSRRASESRRESLSTAKTGSSFEAPLEDEADEDGFTSPVLPSSYLRDYYINNPKLVAQVEASSVRRPSLQSAKSLTSVGDPEETLHSFEEQVYSSPRKAFRPTAQVRTLTAAVSTPQLNIDFATGAGMGALETINGTGRRQRRRSEGEEQMELGDPSLPSVRELVLKFASQSAQSAVDGSNSESLPSPGQEFQSIFPDKKVILEEKALNGQGSSTQKEHRASAKHQDAWSIKKESDEPSVRPQVHSLTARSLPREFREHAQRNLVPRQMNRTVIKSPASPPATACDQIFPAQSLQANSSDNNVAAAGDVTPGYASDESSTSSSLGGGVVSGAARQSSSGKRRPRVAASRGILQRTSYWERRVEQGLLSDSSVTEEFPPLHEGRANSAAKS